MYFLVNRFLLQKNHKKTLDLQGFLGSTFVNELTICDVTGNFKT
jgi:hypothetical protein